jgi:hypothetical protein
LGGAGGEEGFDDIIVVLAWLFLESYLATDMHLVEVDLVWGVICFGRER